MYSLLASEWPEVRERLEARLAGGGLDASERAAAGLGRTIPGLPVRDIAAAVAFYETKFGFEALHQAGDFAVLRRDEAIINLWQSSDERWRGRTDPHASPVVSGAESFLAGTSGTRVETRDVDALFAELEPHGVLHPNGPRVTDTEFGSREFPTLDQDGNLITFFRWL